MKAGAPPRWERMRAWGKRYLLEIALVGLLAGLLAALIAALFDIGLPWMLSRLGIPAESPNGPTGKFTVLASIVTVMGGVLIAIGVVAANRRAVATEKTAKAQVQAAEAQVEANRGAEDGRRQERLKNAIEHLGHTSDSVRMGGAYELFHLAKDTEDLRRTVLDILCAHIRQTTGETGYQEKHKSKPSEEIQSLLTLLFVQEYELFENLNVDLRGSWLNGADLATAQLQGAMLFNVHLERTDLSGANLFEAHLQNSELSGARLEEAVLSEAYLQNSFLFGTHSQGADFSGAYLQMSNLGGAHLQGAEFSEAYMPKSTLSGARLQGACLDGANLQGAGLSGAHLQYAYLRGAKLQGAYVSEAQLHGAYFDGAQLQGVVCLRGDDWSFGRRVRARINKESDLSEVIFSGGLSREDVDSFAEGMTDKEAKELRQKLESHIGQPTSHEPPEAGDVITGSYTREEAEQWIAEYENSMRGVPKPEKK